MTALELIQSTVRLLNINAVGDSLSDDEALEILGILNMMLDSWSNQKYALYTLETSNYSITSGVGSYTIGSGGTFNGERPVRIESAYVRQSNVDYPLAKINSKEYDSMMLKSTTSAFPTCYYYKADYPLGTLYLYPVPAQSLTIYITKWMQINQLSTLQTSISLPPGYLNALRYNLALEIGPQYGMGDKIARGTPIYERAEKYLNEIKVVNTDKSLLNVDSLFTGDSGRFNIYVGA